MDQNQASDFLVTLALISFGFWIVDIFITTMNDWENDDE